MCHRLFADASLYPVRFVGNDALDFVPMTAQSYRASVFLDRRILPAAAAVYRAKLDLLPPRGGFGEAAPAPSYIFHGAYSCSTLLASGLGALRRTLVLREPVPLLQIARRDVPESHLPLAVSLLARTLHSGERVIVKASSACCALAAGLMRQSPQARAVFLYTRLPVFIASVIKDPRRILRLRDTLAMGPRGKGALGMVWPEPTNGSDLSALDPYSLAAWVWLGRMRAFARLSLNFGPERITAMDGDDVARKFSESVLAAARALGLPAASADVDATRLMGMAQRHAKAPAVPFDWQARAREMVSLMAEHRGPIAAAVHWAHGLIPVIDDVAEAAVVAHHAAA